jgi:predicted small metal-binding protein
MRQNWSRTEIIGLITSAIAFLGVIAAWAVVPEFRQLFSTNRQVDNVNSVQSVGEAKTNEPFGKIFNPSDPYPIGFDKVKLGSRVSALQLVYRNGKLESGLYQVNVEGGPFNFVLFHHRGDDDDPVVTRISFHLKDTAAEDYVRDQAVNAFGADKVKSKVRGSVLEWSNINGYKLSMRDTYYSIEMSESATSK